MKFDNFDILDLCLLTTSALWLSVNCKPCAEFIQLDRERVIVVIGKLHSDNFDILCKFCAILDLSSECLSVW